MVDIDDNVYDVSRDNPSEQNTKALRDNINLCLSIADGLTVSVPMLKEIYSPLNKNIFVMPNGLDMKLWDVKRKNKRKIRIGWRGAYGHKADLGLVSDVLKRICEDYDVEFVTFGVEPSFKVKNHTHYDWVPFQDFIPTLTELNFDIAIVPLIDSNYNRSKSNLAILEHSMLKSAVVASPTENQKGLPCLYASTNYEWYEALESLILDKKKRIVQGEKQRRFVSDNFDMALLVGELAKWFEELPRRKDLEPTK